MLCVLTTVNITALTCSTEHISASEAGAKHSSDCLNAIATSCSLSLTIVTASAETLKLSRGVRRVCQWVHLTGCVAPCH